MSDQPNRLILFFSEGISLQDWAENGSLQRETALYREYIRRGWKVSFVTYGGKQDLQLEDQLDGIELLCNRWNIPNRIYAKYLTWLHASAFAHADIIKTNQFSGAGIASKVAQFWKKPFVVRCGYLRSTVAKERLQAGLTTPEELERSRIIEADIFSRAQMIIGTTERIKRYICQNYQVPDERVQVIPNYVRTDIFKPGSTKNRNAIISYVGRYIEEKNLAALLYACQDLPIAINFIGYGPLEESLKALAAKLKLKVNFWGNVPNEKIPGIIEASTAFLLVSIHEGHPKALIEAMSCGLAVIGSNVPGIRDLLEHEVTGYLCDTDGASIHAAIQTVLADEVLRERMGRNARRYALEHFSLEKVFEKENRLLKKTIAENVRQSRIKRFNLELKQLLFGLMGMAIGRLYRPWANFRSRLTGLLHAAVGG